MRKIANTTELQTELRSLLAYAQTDRPSRVQIATALQDLSVRVASPDRATVLKQFKANGYDLTKHNQITHANGKHIDAWLSFKGDGYQVHNGAGKLLWSGTDIADYVGKS